MSERTGCKMLLAQKAFSNYDCYRFFEPYLAGTEASGLFEARLGAEEMPGKEVHVFCAGYRADDFEELLQYADHIVFNSPSQLLRFGAKAKVAGKSVGLRINPECSTQEGHDIYDPVLREAVWVRQEHSGMKHFRKIRNFWIYSMAFTSILSASRIPMIWRQLLFQ